MSELKILINCQCNLAESPVWDDETSSIIWVDISGGNVHQYHLGDRSHKVINISKMIGAVALCTDGNLIGALEDGIAIINRHNGDHHIVCKPEPHLPENRFNDAKCDPAGRLWAGTVSLTEEHGAGNLYRIHKDFSSKTVIEGVTISNGMAWNQERNVFYYIDTPTREVAAFDYDISSGDIKNKRMIIDFKTEDGHPDGMTIDSEGMLWIAHWNGWQISRWNTITGKKLSSVRLPVANVTSCTFGGNGFQHLFITTARKGLSEKELEEQPLAGGIFILENCGANGFAPSKFLTV